MTAGKLFLLGLLVLVPLEMLLGVPRALPWRRWAADTGLAFFNSLITAVPLKLLASGLILAAGWCVPSNLQIAVAAQPVWVQLGEIMILTDLLVYTGHRAFHSKYLWKFHAVHHSAEELDWIVAFRNHPGEIIAMKLLALTPVYALGFATEAVGLYGTAYLLITWFIHGNIQVNLGPLRYLVVTPEFHHWHHANEPTAYNKNFSGQFPFWDWLFGTLHLPYGCKPAAYGVDHPMPQDLVGLLLFPFRRRKKRAAIHPVKDPAE